MSDRGFPVEREDEEADRLQCEVEESAVKLVDDLNIFGEEN